MKNTLYIFLLCCPVIAAAQGYTLEQCIDMALKNNYLLRNSRLDYEMAEQIVKEAYTKFFPSVSAAGISLKASEYIIDESIDLTPFGQVFTGMGIDPVAAGLPPAYPVQMIKDGVLGIITATQPVFTGGQIINGNRLARLGREVSRLQMIMSGNEVVARTEEYFWQIVSLKEKLKTLSAADTQLEEVHKSVNATVNAGITTRNDLLRVELRQQNNQSNRLKVENGIKVYGILLRNHTGAGKEDFNIAISSFPPVKDPSEYYIPPEEGIQRRIENQLLDKNVEAASLQRKMTTGKNMPQVAAGAGYVYHNLSDRDVDFGMIFATLSVPISSWWGISYAIKREKYNEMKVENQRQNMKEMMIVDIESKWNDLRESYQQIIIAQKSIESATENIRINDDFYKAGTTSLTDLLNAQTLLQQSHDQYTDACTTYYLKLSAYLKSTGRYAYRTD
jgi:outer membrane protein TolC